MKLALLAIPLLLGATAAGLIWSVFDPGALADGLIAGLRRLVGRLLALVAFVAGAAAGLMFIH